MRPPAPPRQPRREPPAEPRGVAPEVTAPADRPASAPERPAGTDVGEACARRGSRVLGRLRQVRHRPAAGDFATRLTERARAERRLLWRKVLIALAAVAVLAGLAWVVLASPLLALAADQVEVSGTGEGTTVATAEVVDLVEPHLGTPLPRLDLSAVREEVEQVATVRSAEIHRSWPRGLEVVVVAREPVAALVSEGRVELLDVDGIVVGDAEEVPEEMPQVDVPPSGDRSAQTLQAVLTVLAELPAAVREEVTLAGATSPATIVLELADGAEVHWGTATEAELKIAVLEVLRSESAEVYDVTVPRSPTTS